MHESAEPQKVPALGCVALPEEQSSKKYSPQTAPIRRNLALPGTCSEDFSLLFLVFCLSIVQ